MFRTVGRDRIYVQATFGEGIGSFINDGSFNLAPQDSRADAIPLFSMIAFYDHYWNDRWSTTFGYSRLDMDTRNQQLPSEFRQGQYGVVNLLHDPAEDLTLGIEGTYRRRQLIDGTSAPSYRIKFAIQYAFDVSWRR